MNEVDDRKFNDNLYYDIDCPIQVLGTVLGKKWVGKIIWNIKNDKKRFG